MSMVSCPLRSLSRAFLVSLMVLLLSSAGAYAIDYVWTGNAASNELAWWGNANNWTPAGVPGPMDTATIGGPLSYQIQGNTRTVGGLTLLPGAELDSGTDLTVTQVMHWEGGMMHGDLLIAPSAVMHISGEGDRILYLPNTGSVPSFRNQGHVIVSNNGDIVGGQINNSGTFEVRNDRAFVGVAFVNNGFFIKTGGTGITRFAFPSGFYQVKTIEVRSGVVELNRGSSAGHQFTLGCTVKGPGVLRITEPSFDPAAPPQYGVSLEAKVRVYGVNIEQNGVIELGHGGVLTAGQNPAPGYDARVSGPGVLNWTGGKITDYLDGTGLLLEPGTHLLISGDAPRILDFSSRLITQGRVTWTGTGALEINSATSFISSGEFVAQGNTTAFKPAGSSSFPAVFENRGTFRKEGAETTTTFNQVQFDNYGDFDVPEGTLLFLASPFQHVEGNISLHNANSDGPGGVLALRGTNGARGGFSFQTGNLIGPGTIDGGFTNQRGAVYPAYHRGGVLRILGSYTQMPSASLHITVAGPTAADVSQLEIGGTFSPSGLLSVWLPEGYIPEAGLRFQIANRAPQTSVNAFECATANFIRETGPDYFGLLATDKPPWDSKALQNISTRGVVGTGDNALIGGLIIRAPVQKSIVIRALGPSLTKAGVAGALSDPMLQLYDGSGTLIAENDNWAEGPNKDYLGALAPSNSSEAVIADVFPAGNYTAIVRGAQETTGAALVEIYDIGSPWNGRAVNLSTRGRVGVGDNVMINGFILGEQPRRLLIRAVGPSLGQLNPPVPDPLLDPSLTLHDATGAIIASNDDWGASEQKEAILKSSLAPQSAKESAFLLKLSPGTYTAVLRGTGNTSGNALIEIYDLD
jgi:hypothetical protein